MLETISPLACVCVWCGHTWQLSSTNLLFSGGNTSSSLHHDGYDNMLALLSGHKTAILIPDAHSEDLYMNDFVTYPGLSPIEPDSVDLDKFPRMTTVPYGRVEMEAGKPVFDCFFV